MKFAELKKRVLKFPGNTEGFTAKTKHLMGLREIVADCCVDHTKHINKLCGQNVGFGMGKGVNLLELLKLSPHLQFEMWGPRVLLCISSLLSVLLSRLTKAFSGLVRETMQKKRCSEFDACWTVHRCGN